MTRTITIILISVAAILLIGWDIYAAIHPMSGDTISEVILGCAARVKMLPLSFGVLIGHFFWPWLYPVWWKCWSIPALVVVALAGISLDITGGIVVAPAIIVSLIGIVLGHLLWPQKPSQKR